MKPMNILMIPLASLRADHLSCYGYQRAVTPNIDRLASEGTIFEQAYSTAAWTPPAYASLLTGLYPSSHRVFGGMPLDDSIPTMASLLTQTGYHATGFVTSVHMGRYTRLDRGFQEFDEFWANQSKRGMHKVDRIAKRIGLMDKGTKWVTQRAIEWLDNHVHRKQPFFMLLGYDETHHPYDAPLPYKYRYVSRLGRDIDWHRIQKINTNPYLYISGAIQTKPHDFKVLKALYDAEIRYLDKHLGRLFAHMRRLEILDHTLVVVVSLHGENMGEHGLGAHLGCLYETLLHIPLVIRYPEVVPTGLRVQSLIQLTDILPTLLDLTKYDANGLMLQGHSLLPIQQGLTYREYIAAEWDGSIPAALHKLLTQSPERQPILEHLTRTLRAIRQGDYKYIRGSDGSEELFNLASDPDELCNLATRKPKRAHTLAIRLEKCFGSRNRQANNSEPEEIEETILKGLRTLGYKIRTQA